MSNYYSVKWSVSRGMDTYGYNICTLTNVKTGRRYQTKGGGYDMTGAVLGDMIQEEYQDKLFLIQEKARYFFHPDKPNRVNESGLTGLAAQSKGKAPYDETPDKITIDGACGVSSVIEIAKDIGLTVTEVYDRSKRNPPLIGFFVSEA